MKDAYQELEYLLKQKSIYSAKDVLDLSLPHSHPEYITGDDYDWKWIEAVIATIKIAAQRTEYNISNKGGQFFCIEDKQSDIANVSKYLCFFPERGLIKTIAPSISLDDYNLPYYPTLKRDYLVKYFEYHELMAHDIIDLYPSIDLNAYCDPVFELGQHENIAFLSNAGCGIQNYEAKQQGLFLAFPWIYSARVEDFIELQSKYSIEFRQYNNIIAKISHESKNINDFNNSVLLEAEKAYGELTLLFKQKKRDLLRRGIMTTIGIAFTFLPTVFPDLSKIIDPKLYTTIVGGSTVCDTLNKFSNLFELSDLGKQNPFWITWKWMQTNK